VYLHGGGWKTSTTVHGTISMVKRKTKWKKRPIRSDILPKASSFSKQNIAWIKTFEKITSDAEGQRYGSSRNIVMT